VNTGIVARGIEAAIFLCFIGESPQLKLSHGNSELAAVLTALGCPSEKSAEMAAQLDKRAVSLPAERPQLRRSLQHLLSDEARLGGDRQKPVARIQNPEFTGCAPNYFSGFWLLASEFCPHDIALEKNPSTPIGDFRIFKLRSDVKLSPRTGKEHDFYVLDSVDWVNVIALTPDQKL